MPTARYRGHIRAAPETVFAFVSGPDGDGLQIELTVTPRILGRRVDALASRILQRATRGRESGDFRRLRAALER